MTADRIEASSGSIAVDRQSGQLIFHSLHLPAPLKSRVGFTTTRGPFASNGGEVRCTTDRSGIFPGGTVLHCEQGQLLWNLHTDGRGFAIEAGARDVADAITRFTLFDGESPQLSSMLVVAYCGAHSRSRLSASKVVDLDESTDERSWWCSAFADGSGRGMVLGFLSAMRFTGAIDVERGVCRAYNFAENVRGSEVWSEPLFVGFTNDVAEELRTYAGQAARMTGAPPPKPPVSGWASWLHYGADFDERTVLENADELARWFEGSPQRPVVHIDHGWEKRVRLHRPDLNWEPRPDFTRDLPGLVAGIAAKNLRTGLWVVPFAINVGAAGAERLLDLVVRDASGNPKLVGAGQNYCIDPTHPAGERWLRELFHRFRSWGVSYFKLEYLRLLLAPEPLDAEDGLDSIRVYARAKTRAEAYRYGLEVIRDVVGPDTYLLGCGAPALPSAGLVDSHRIGGDIERWWSKDEGTGVRHSARNAAANVFWNGRTWRNDPDVLAAFDEPNLQRFWTTTVALSGGTAMVSASLRQLTPMQHAAIRGAMPSLGIAAVPRGNDTWHLALPAHHLLAFFNSSDDAREFMADITDLGELAWDFWNDRPAEVRGNALHIQLPPRDAALIGIRRRLSQPQLCGSTLHYGMGALDIAASMWDRDRRQLTTTLTEPRRNGSLAFHVPPPFRLLRASIAAAEVGAEMFRVTVDERTARTIEMEFAEEP